MDIPKNNKNVIRNDNYVTFEEIASSCPSSFNSNNEKSFYDKNDIEDLLDKVDYLEKKVEKMEQDIKKLKYLITHNNFDNDSVNIRRLNILLRAYYIGLLDKPFPFIPTKSAGIIFSRYLPSPNAVPYIVPSSL